MNNFVIFSDFTENNFIQTTYYTKMLMKPGAHKLYIEADNSVIANNTNAESKYISFMIFRTGSVLIVGKCNEEILTNTYNFIVNILETEQNKIMDKRCVIEPKQHVVKKKKRRIILVTNSN